MLFFHVFPTPNDGKMIKLLIGSTLFLGEMIQFDCRILQNKYVSIYIYMLFFCVRKNKHHVTREESYWKISVSNRKNFFPLNHFFCTETSRPMGYILTKSSIIWKMLRLCVCSCFCFCFGGSIVKLNLGWFEPYKISFGHPYDVKKLGWYFSETDFNCCLFKVMFYSLPWFKPPVERISVFSKHLKQI